MSFDVREKDNQVIEGSKEIQKTKLKDNPKKFSKGVYKKLVAGALATAITLTPMMSRPQKAYAWGDNAHKLIANQAIICLRNDKPEVAKYLYENNGAQTIIDYSTEPDISERDLADVNLWGYSIGAFRAHFYNPTTGANYRGEKNPTANTRFRDHYDLAVSSYKKKMYNLAWQELGRAIHYLGDLNAPHHAANVAALDTNLKQASLTHGHYEDWVNSVCRDYAINNASEETYKYALNNNVWQVGHDMAVNANGYAYMVATQYREKDVNNRKAATNGTLPKAQRIAAGILYKFLKDVGKVK